MIIILGSCECRNSVIILGLCVDMNSLIILVLCMLRTGSLYWNCVWVGKL